MATPGCVMVFVLLGFASRVEGGEVKISLNASMLEMHPGIATKANGDKSSVATAVDGDYGIGVNNGPGWYKCVTSDPNLGVAHWMNIDLKGLFFISNVTATFRYDEGEDAGVFVGNNPSVTDGVYEYQCGDRLPNNTVQSAPYIHMFACQPARWASHVSIQRTGYEYIQICEVEVYYKQNTTVGVSISLTPTPQTVFVGEPLLCTTRLVSSNAKDLLQLQWLYPNGSAVSQQSNDSVSQQYNDNSVGLSFNSVTAPQGNYSCRYTLNGKQRSQTVSVSGLDCGWSEWSSCSESCRKGTRRGQHRNSVTQRSESGCNPTQQCFNTTCGKLNLTKIGASATQGPESQSTSSMSASLAIDGRIVTDNSNRLNLAHCAASKSSSSVRTWLRIDLQNVYLINEVIVTFYGSTGRKAMIRVGSNTSNDGNDNLLCGTVEDYTDSANRVNVQRTVQCKEKLWGRYVNVQRQTAQNLEICEVEIYTELDVGILYNESNVTTVYVDEGGDLPQAILCGVSPDTTGYNDALKLNWRRDDGTSIPRLSNPTNTISQSSNNQQNLYVKNVSVDEEGWYVCEYTIPETNQMKTESVEILVNVDCGWSEWGAYSGTCGVASRRRSADSPMQRHRGKECKGPAVDNCTDRCPPPCPPSITGITTTEVDEGGSLQMKCEGHVPGLQNPNQTVDFEWAKYGKDGKEVIISVTTASHEARSQFQSTLLLMNVSRVDSGFYKCRISSSVGTSNYSTNSVNLNVKFAPENVTLHNVPMVAVKGQSVTFNCTAGGNPAPTYTWLKDGKPVSSKRTFPLGSVSFASAGVYVCVASNTIEAGAKTDNASASVKVEGPPQSCNISRAVSYNSSSLTLNVACFNGNSPITGYRLRFKKTASSEWASRNVTANNNDAGVEEVVLRDLEAYTQYDVQVKAGNKHGYEAGSDSFSMIKTVRTAEGEPSRPLSVSISSVAARSVTISWKPPMQPNGNISAYQVFIRQSDGDEIPHSVKFSATSLRLMSLKPYTTYLVEVIAVNIRSIDNHTLNGQRSNVTTFTTSQSAPTEPVSLKASFTPPTSLTVTWDQPVEPNGVLKYYNVRYLQLGGNDSFMMLPNVTDRAVVFNVTYGGSYLVQVQAVTVEAGPFANITRAILPSTPSEPRNVSVVSLSATTLSVRWIKPERPNGNIHYYTIWYSTNGQQQSIRVPDPKFRSYNVTGLSPYTNYTISMTVTNDATVDNESDHSNEDSSRTLSTVPEKPSPPQPIPSGVSSHTVIFTAPPVSNVNGPVKYVDIVVSYRQENGSLGQYIALRYNYKDYQDMIAGRTISLGSGSNTTDSEGREHRDRRLQPATRYSVYTRVFAQVDGLGLVEVRSEPLNFTTSEVFQPTTEPSSPTTSMQKSTEASSDGGSQVPIRAIGGAIAAIAILVALLIVVLIIRRNRQDKSRDNSLRQQIRLTTVKPLDMDNDYAPPAELDTPDEPNTVPNVTELLNITAYAGTTTLLPSDVIGDPKPTISWRKDRKQLPGKNPRLMVLGDGALQIEDIQASDAGIYVCFAGNEMGADEQKVQLTVKKQDAQQKCNPWQNPSTPVIPVKRSMRHINSGLHAIPIDEFPDYVAALHGHENAGFYDEFKSLDKVGRELPATAFQAHMDSNRYKNIPTYDHSRVVLPILPGISDSQSDYIAAAYVDGYRKPKKYIAAQGPLEHTCTDFWTMIWAEDIPTIVMLTHLTEGMKVKCHQYWPDKDGGISMYGCFAVTLERTDVYADYTLRTLTVALGEQKRELCQYHFTAWPDHDVPKFATGLLSFIGRVNRGHAHDKGPIAVHCSAGVGRTGTYIVIDTMLERAEDGQPIDIYSCLASLRTRRAQMVQAQVQYMFIHDAVMEGVICGNTEIPVVSLRSAVTKMSKKDPKSNTSGFELHFKVLQASGPYPDKQSCRAGLHPAVQTKNRYSDVVPFDRSRVILNALEDSSSDNYVNTAVGSDYINASFVDGYRRRDAFIVTQSPLEQTVNDFWKMIWEQSSYAIVMLTPLEEEGKEMCHQYWPASGSTEYGSITVEMKDETQRKDYVMRRMMVTKDAQTRMVTQFHYTDWPENGSPRSLTGMLNMVGQLQKWQQAIGDKVITLHCNNGVGRSGAFCGLLTLIEIIKMETAIDFYHKVKAMRIQRPGMVQTVDQYMFMHEAILAYLDSFQTYDNFK